MAEAMERIHMLTLTAALLSAAPLAQADCPYEAGMEAFIAGEAAEAEAAFRACIAEGASLPESHFHLGILARNADRLEEAEAQLREAVRLGPEHLSWRLEWAVTHEWQGELQAAKKIYRGVLEQEAGNVPARLGLARMEHWLGHLRRSLALYRDLLREQPDHRGVQSGLAFALLADQKLEESRALFEQLLASDPDDASARKGLEMLAAVRPRRLDAAVGQVRDALGQDIRQYRLSYVSKPSYALKWGVELVGRDGFVSPPDSSGVPVNRAVKSSVALFGEVRFNAKTSMLGGLRREELAGDEDQYKLQMEIMHAPSERHRLFAGAVPAWIEGRHVNTLAYAGYVYQPNTDWNLMAQYYYGADREFPNSQALSVSWSRNYGRNSWFRVGASVSETSSRTETSGFFSLRHHLSRDWAITASLVDNFSSNEREINLGISYEF